MRAAIYARVSTIGQGQSPEMQIRELANIVSDEAGKSPESMWTLASRAKDSRPEVNRLVADAHCRRFDDLVVWKFDRFARSVSHLLRALETFNSLGVAFVSLSEQSIQVRLKGK